MKGSKHGSTSADRPAQCSSYVKRPSTERVSESERERVAGGWSISVVLASCFSRSAAADFGTDSCGLESTTSCCAIVSEGGGRATAGNFPVTAAAVLERGDGAASIGAGSVAAVDESSVRNDWFEGVRGGSGGGLMAGVVVRGGRAGVVGLGGKVGGSWSSAPVSSVVRSPGAGTREGAATAGRAGVAEPEPVMAVVDALARARSS